MNRDHNCIVMTWLAHHLIYMMDMSNVFTFYFSWIWIMAWHISKFICTPISVRIPYAIHKETMQIHKDFGLCFRFKFWKDPAAWVFFSTIKSALVGLSAHTLARHHVAEVPSLMRIGGCTWRFRETIVYASRSQFIFAWMSIQEHTVGLTVTRIPLRWETNPIVVYFHTLCQKVDPCQN